MDEMDNNKQKTIFGKLKSSISDIFPAALSKTGATSSFCKADCEVDIDSVEEESSNHDNSNFKVNREFRKLENQRNLIRKLADLKSKNQYNNEISNRSKFQNHNTSLKDDVVINESLTSTNSEELVKLKTNYRTLCDIEIRKPVECVLSPQNPLNNSGFLSMSRQSLNDSVNETGISSTASRIAANILNKSNSQKTDIINKTSSNLSSKSFSMRTRRYRTIIKQDKFSSYLTRVPKEDNLFNVPNLSTSNVILNLSCSEDSTKRVDFSYAHIIQDQHNKVKESIDSNIYWTCVNCNSSNPSNFNFCPTCSTSNPKLVLKEKNFKPLMDDNKNIWVCSRCSTKNDECRIVCIFCFKNKNISTKKPKLDLNNDEQCLNSKVDLPKKFNFTETDHVNLDFNFDSSNEASNAVKPVKSHCESCLSDSERETCLSCNPKNSSNKSSCNSQLPQPKFIFGSSSFPTEDAKTASHISSRDECISEQNKKEANGNSKWNCSVCLAENNPEWERCVCCTAANPNKTEVQQSKPHFLFGSSNIPTENSAIKFGSSGNVLDKPESAFVFGQSHSTKFVFGKQDLVGRAAELKSGTKWNCSECWAENEPEREKCACCSSRKSIPTSSGVDKETVKFGSANEGQIAEHQSILFGTSIDQAGPAGKKWGCPDCWVENGADKDKCVCCAAPSPAVPRTSATPMIPFGSISANDAPRSAFTFGSATARSVPEERDAARKWNCSECWVENGADRENCACCGGRNPSAITLGSSRPSVPAALPTFVFNGSNSTDNRPQTVPIKFGNAGNSGTKLSVTPALQNGIGKNPQTKWGCPTCLVENEESLPRCACCQTKNPDSSAGLDRVPIFNFHQEQSQPSFKFGCSADAKPNPRAVDTCDQIGNGCDDPKSESRIEKPGTLSSNLFDTDCPLKFIFSPPQCLPVTASTQVPVDLQFEFSSPQFL